MLLTDTKCRQKPGSAKIKLNDGGGLYLEIRPNGGRFWRMRYSFGGGQKEIYFGQYPDLTLVAARAKRDEARELVASGTDPAAQQRSEKVEQKLEQAAGRPFREIAQAWFDETSANEEWRPKTIARNTWTKNRIDAKVGNRAIESIMPFEWLSIFKATKEAGLRDTGRRMKTMADRIYKYAIGECLAERNPVAEIEFKGSKKTRKFPGFTAIKDVVNLLRDIETYDTFLTRSALKFQALVAQRPGNVSGARWSEFDLGKAVWSIPKEKMKMDKDLKLPLARQAVALLREVKAITGNCEFVFSTNDVPMSENTMNKALRILGYDTTTEHCAHGFRTTFSTLCNEETGPDDMPIWMPELIELQLAHRKKEDEIRRIYNEAKLMPARIKLMQHWADRLDIMRDGAKVLPIKRPA